MYEEIGDFLNAEAKRRHVRARISIHNARRDNGYLHVPVYIEGVEGPDKSNPDVLDYAADDGQVLHIRGQVDAYDKAVILQDLEDTWNDQEPKPEIKVFLRPAAPPREAVGSALTVSPSEKDADPASESQ
jgi:hypothetical protein